MSSSFAWIDHSEAHRRKMLDAIDLFREQGTRDELGLSVIRDGFANLLFPGTGALQTRARYFFFVPWMYQLFESEQVRSSDVTRRDLLLNRLIDAVVASEDSAGAIGSRARGELQRLPSSIYWNGMRRLQIRALEGSQDDYHRSLDADYGGSQASEDRRWGVLESVPPTGIRSSRRLLLDSGPRELEEGEGAGAPELERDEAEYLSDRIGASVGSPCSTGSWTICGSAQRRRSLGARIGLGLPARLRRQVQHARAFSEVMAGASILYNGLVCEGPPR